MFIRDHHHLVPTMHPIYMPLLRSLLGFRLRLGYRHIASTKLERKPSFRNSFYRMANAYTQIVTLARKEKMPMRLAALSLGIKRVQEAERILGLFPLI